jgi:hypothetical protein
MALMKRFTQPVAEAILPPTIEELRGQLGQAQTALTDAVRSKEAAEQALLDVYGSTATPDDATLAPVEAALASAKLACERGEKTLWAAQDRVRRAEQVEGAKRRENGAKALQAALKDRSKGAEKIAAGAALIAEGKKLVDRGDSAAVASDAVSPHAVLGYNYGPTRTELLVSIALRHHGIGDRLPDGTQDVVALVEADNGLMQS